MLCNVSYRRVFRIVGYDLDDNKYITDWFSLELIKFEVMNYLARKQNKYLKDWQIEYDFVICVA